MEPTQTFSSSEICISLFSSNLTGHNFTSTHFYHRQEFEISRIYRTGYIDVFGVLNPEYVYKLF